jgi:hypothetical protein
VSPSQLDFTSANATTPQSLTVTATGNANQAGDIVFQIQFGPIVSSDPDFAGLTEDVPVIARPLAPFVVGSSGSYDVTAHGYTVTLQSGSVPLSPGFDGSTQTVSGTPAAGTAGSYPLTFQGAAASTTFTVNVVIQNGASATNPAPTLGQVAPSAATAGSGDTTLTLTGSDFLSSSTVDFNGAALATTFVSNTELTAVVPAADLASAGMAAITVVTPGPGGGTSAPQSLTINPPAQTPVVPQNPPAPPVTTAVIPAVTQQPSNQTAKKKGVTVTFKAAASGTPAPGVQWQVSTDKGKTFTPVPGATQTTLTLKASAADAGTLYEAVFTNQAGKATSAAAVLTVKGVKPAHQRPAGGHQGAGHHR